MPVPLSSDLRERIVRAVEKGSSIRQAALRFEVSPSAAIKLMRRVRESGSSAPARFGGHRRPMLDEHEALVRTLLDGKPDITMRRVRESGSSAPLLDAKPDMTLAEMQAELARGGIVVRATSTILRWLRRAGLTRKKRS